MVGGSAEISRSLSLGQALMTSCSGVWGLVFTPSMVRETRHEPATCKAGRRFTRGPGKCTKRLRNCPDQVWRPAANMEHWPVPLASSWPSMFTEMEMMSGHKRPKLRRESQVNPFTSFRRRLKHSALVRDRIPPLICSACFLEQCGPLPLFASSSVWFASHNILSSISSSSSSSSSSSLSADAASPFFLQFSTVWLCLLSLHTSSSLGTPSLSANSFVWLNSLCSMRQQAWTRPSKAILSRQGRERSR